MDAIKVQNLRCITSTGVVNLSPITFLVGANSSGKSTFLRTFPLLKQSVNLEKSGPILWYGGEVDFGDYKTSLRRGADEMVVTVYYNKLYSPRVLFNHVELELSIKYERKSDYVKILKLRFDDIAVEIHYGRYLKDTFVSINGSDYSKYFDSRIHDGQTGLIPALRIRNNDDIEKFLMSSISKLGMAEISFGKHVRIMSFLLMSYSVEEIKRVVSDGAFNSRNNIFKPDDDGCRKLLELVVFALLHEILMTIDQAVSEDMSSISYIKPLRTTSERYYRNQNLSVKDLDSDGHNMAMYLNALFNNRAYKKNFRKWTLDNFCFEVDAVKKDGHTSVLLKKKDADHWDNITDLGFGFSQILPVIIEIWNKIYKGNPRKGIQSANRKVILIEQPELHLHPKMQAEFADMLALTIDYTEKNNIPISYIIETHSQVIINRIGIKVATNSIDKESVKILLFETQSNNNKEFGIRTATYDEEGYLMNWPVGFFEPKLY